MRTRRLPFVLHALALAAVLHAQSAPARMDIGDRLPAQPDPSPGTPVDSGGGGACLPDPHRCHGVVGLACDGVLSTEAEATIVLAAGTISPQAVVLGVASILETAYSGCAPDGSCVINAGSWDHDECCFDHPSGHFCGIENAFASSNCTAVWDKAVHRVVHGLNWRRHVDQCRVDDDGTVDFAEYCAPAGTIVASTDRQKCCGRRTRAFRLERDLGQALAQALILDGTFQARVCVGGRAQDPAPTGGESPVRRKPAAAAVDQRAAVLDECAMRVGAICAAPSPGQPKVCLLV